MFGFPVALMSLGVWQWHHAALCNGAFCVSRQHRLCYRWPGCTFMFYSWKADVFVIHCLWKNVYDWWITSNSPCKWHRTGSTTSGWKSSPRKIFHQNSSGEYWLKFIGKRIEEDNHQNSTVKATSSTQQPAQTCTEAVTTHYIHCKQNWWREGTPTADASKSDEKIGQWLKFTFKIIFFNVVIGGKSVTWSVQCTSRISFHQTLDTNQPLYTLSNNGFCSKLYFTMNSLEHR